MLGRIHGYGSDTINMVSQARAMLRSKRDDEEFTRVVVTLVQMLELLMAEQDKRNLVGVRWGEVGMKWGLVCVGVMLLMIILVQVKEARRGSVKLCWR